MSTVLKHLLKFLNQHEAQLSIDTRAEPPELILRIPASIAADGTFTRYALEYRLGQHLPHATTPRLDAPDPPPA